MFALSPIQTIFQLRGISTSLVRITMLCAGTWAGTICAVAADLPSAEKWSRTSIDVSSIAGRRVTLAEVFALVEDQTRENIGYAVGQLPLGSEVTMGPAGTTSLAKLFEAISFQQGVRFELRDGRIAALAGAPAGTVAATVGRIAESRQVPRSEPELVRPSDESARVAISDPAPALALAETVGAIAGKAKVSRERKARQISDTVRSAVVAAAKNVSDPGAVLASAKQLAAAAAVAAPDFVEAIAGAASFAPAVAKVRGGSAQVRATAYAATRAPATEPVIRTRDDAQPKSAAPAEAAPRDVVAAAPAAQSPAATVTSVPVVTSPTDAAAGAQVPVAAQTETTAAATFPVMPPMGSSPIYVPPETAAAPATPAAGDGVIKMEKFGVEGTVTRGSAADLRLERMKANVSIDTLGADQLAKFASSDLSDVVFRLPGVSVANGQFAVVRGLSDRFLSTTLQGVKLPTPDPEKQAVQLDLIPASAVEAVVVAKTYEASQWAESSGGNMDVRTRAIPTEGQLKLSVGFKVNSNAPDGGPDYTIRGGTNERLGFGSRSRLAPGTTDPTWQYIPLHRDSFPPGNKVAVEYARAFDFGEQQLGILANVFNESGYKAKSGRKQAKGAQAGTPASAGTPATSTRPAVPSSPGRPSNFETGLPTSGYVLYDYQESESENVLGATAAFGYKFSENHELKLTGVFVQSGIDLAQVSYTGLTTDPVTKLPTTIAGRGGYSGAEENAWFHTFEYFRERNLTVFQLAGRHTLPAVGKLKVNWAAQRGSSYQKDSPFIEADFASPLTALHKTYTVFGGSDAPQPLKVLWADNQEKQSAARLDLEWPFRFWSGQDSAFNAGAAFDSTGRETSGIAIDTRLPSGGSPSSATPNGAFAKVTSARQGGIATPPTSTNRDITAYYFGTTLSLVKYVKLIAGARYEALSLAATGSGKWGGNLTSASFYGINPAKTILGVEASDNPPFTSQKWYPGAGFILGPWREFSLRLHYSRTSGRPSLREVSPFFNKSVETGNLVIGNPGLKPAEATNFDVRLEWAPRKTDFFSVSAFRKEIDRPIEKMLFNQTSPASGEATESWVNNPGRANLEGVEFEFRHQFRGWSELLRDFSLSGNYTSIKATVPEHPIIVSQLLGMYQNSSKIPRNRRLFDQPEQIANLELTWARRASGTSVTLAAFMIGDVLATAGKPFFFDLYEREHTRVDFIFGQQLGSRLKLKLSVKNLTNPQRGLIYDREATTLLVERNTYRLGRDFSGSLSYEF